MIERTEAERKPAFTTHFKPAYLPGIERVDYGRCSEHPFEDYDHAIRGCAHWHVGTADICAAPCIPEPKGDDAVPVAILHEYAHYLVGGDTSGNNLVIAHGRKWRDKFGDLLELHHYERPSVMNAHTGGCSQSFNICTPSDDSEGVEMCDFTIDAYAMIWNIFESETRLRNSTVEETIEDFMARFAARGDDERSTRAIATAFVPRLGDGLKALSVPVDLQLRKSTVDAFIEAAEASDLEPLTLVQRFIEQSAYTL